MSTPAVNELLESFAQALIDQQYAAAHQCLASERRSTITPDDLEKQLGPDERHRFLCEIYEQDPDEADRLPNPDHFVIDGFPYRDAPADHVGEPVGWYCIDLQPDEDSGYDTSGQLGVFVVNTPEGYRIDQCEWIEPD